LTKKDKIYIMENIIDIEKKIYISQYMIIAILKSFKLSKKEFDLIMIDAEKSYLEIISKGSVESENNDK